VTENGLFPVTTASGPSRRTHSLPKNSPALWVPRIRPLPVTWTSRWRTSATRRELHGARSDLCAGRIDSAAYEEGIEAEIRDVISFEEKAGIDVLVHGEPERWLR
jgi:hypothetical protein